jgi:hypothetical protein
MSNIFGLLLTDEGLTELRPVLKDYWSEGPIGKYLYCKEANPDRNYFHIVAEGSNRDGTKFEAEIYIPHRFVKVVVSATDRKHIGFI